METFSHLCAATGFICVETREENRYLHHVLSQMPSDIQVGIMSAPNGAFRAATLKNGKVFIDPTPILKPSGNPMDLMLFRVLKWASEGPGRVVLIFDWHMLCNAPVHWRAAIEAQPSIRSPLGADEAEHKASLVVFVGPSFKFEQYNPLYGEIPVLQFALPDRGGLMKRLTDDFGERDDLDDVALDALCGLSSDVAAQAAAETLQRLGRLDPAGLNDARVAKLKDGNLEVWSPVSHIGGLSGFVNDMRNEVIPWVRDPQLAVKRILLAGTPGTGKSYAPRWLAHELDCLAVRLSIPSLKAGVVGASEANLRRCLRTLDAMSKYSPLVVIVDEIDTIARDGLDGGTSSGMFAELLTWLQESQSQAIVCATLNRLDKLDAALESRFALRYFVDLPNQVEREAVAKIHFARLGCERVDAAAKRVAAKTKGFSSREIAEHVCPSAARISHRKLDDCSLDIVVSRTVPASTTQEKQLEVMRDAGKLLRRANDEDENNSADPSPSRRISPSMN